MKYQLFIMLCAVSMGFGCPTLSVAIAGSARESDGDGTVTVTGQRQQWHKITLSLSGPFARESDDDPNPFTDYALRVTWTHESGTPSYEVMGYFAADGNAAESAADAGTVWRAHLSPDRAGKWDYRISFTRGHLAALSPTASGEPLSPFHGQTGSFEVGPTEKSRPDLRARGRLQYVGKHHLRFAGTGEFFLKAGPDAPETLLAYTDFDGTQAHRPDVPLKTWQAHVRDWREGDPAWRSGRGKGLIGALNYLAEKGVNSFSFLPYNAGGDGDNVWPFVSRNDKLHYDCSKLDQWGIVFDHATAKGLHLHFKLQENEIDDDRVGDQRTKRRVTESLDGGKLGPERMLYCRELVSRFGHALALNWNIGEENTQSTAEVVEMVRYLHDIDPYDHHIVLHTFPGEQDEVYEPLLGERSLLTGVSLQNAWDATHRQTCRWVDASAASGRPWVVANDEQNPAAQGVPPDPGYQGHSGEAVQNGRAYTLHEIRKATLWGNLMGGGAGVEYYFGYQLPQNDLLGEDFRSRDRTWDYCRIALGLFADHRIPFWDMRNADHLIGNATHDNSRYCLVRQDQIYLVYVPNGGDVQLQLDEASGTFAVEWFNPRQGGPLQRGSVSEVMAGTTVALGQAPSDPDQDWLIVVRRK